MDESQEVTPVRRDRRRSGRTRRGLWFGGAAVGLAAAVVGVAVAVSAGDQPPPTTAVSTTTTTTSEPQVQAVTTEPAPETYAPLTGLPSTFAAVQRPVILAKVDAVRQAMPQSGLHQADVVIEAQVEGANRYLAVWHSQDPETIGPLRSARTTDIDILSMFAKPLFAFSGGNEGVLQMVRSAPWKVELSHSTASSAYHRMSGRRMPHNLMASTASLREHDSEGLAPVPLFHFHPPGTPPAGLPVSSFSAAAGARSTFTWDESLGAWRRNIWGIDHVDAGGEPIAPTNVVVLDTPYGISPADQNSPEAQTLGTGSAWVLSRGHVVAGTWTRNDNAAPWDLRDGAGQPITLEPGRTWVVLATGAPELNAG